MMRLFLDDSLWHMSCYLLWKMLCTFTLAHSELREQCPVRVFYIVNWRRHFPVVMIMNIIIIAIVISFFCRVFKIIYPKQTTYLGNVVMPLFYSYNCSYTLCYFPSWMFCNFTLVLSAVCVQCPKWFVFCISLISCFASMLLRYFIIYYYYYYYRRFSSHLDYSYDTVLNYLTLHILSVRRLHPDALFLTNIFNGSEYCPILLESVGLRVPNRNFRGLEIF